VQPDCKPAFGCGRLPLFGRGTHAAGNECKTALEPLDLTTKLSISESSIGLFGKSGAGKSTLLGLIAGTIQPQSGHIVLDGKILFAAKKVS
jgi:ABC-type sulfate/molybdate transport systems ATPase subunit